MFGAEKYRGWLQRPLLEKKDSNPPDYTPMANASKEAAQIMAGLGREQLDFARQQYNDAKPLFQQIVGSQIAAQNETMRQARDYYDYQVNTYRPLEQGLVRDAQQFDTDAYREQLATKAAADAGRAFSGTQAATQRAMASMGVNPNSGRFASLQNQNALGLAAQQANAMTNTRQQAEQVGYARKLDAAGLGRNLAGASNAAYGMALNAGNAAGHNQMAPGLGYTQMATPGINAIGSGQQMQLQGFGNILNAQANVYTADSNNGLDAAGLLNGVAALYKAA